MTPYTTFDYNSIFRNVTLVRNKHTLGTRRFWRATVLGLRKRRSMNKNNKVIYLKNKLNRLYKKLIVNNLKRVVFGLYFFFF